jgi:16S rRNA pseudouridine516 synthase
MWYYLFKQYSFLEVIAMRLDKLLSHAGYGSRKDVKTLIKKGRVSLNGEPAKSPELHIDPDKDSVLVDGEKAEYVKYVYLLMNKPDGVISATTDPYGQDKTVSDLAFELTGIWGLFPVGRLDKDATGLLILTNDGILGHRATSPKKNAEKIYEVEVSGELSESDAAAFKNRIKLDDGYLCREARLEILSQGPSSRALVTLTEGKFHQVKRMFQALGKSVTSLKRVSFCGIELPGDLPEGQCRPLTEGELDKISHLLAEE